MKNINNFTLFILSVCVLFFGITPSFSDENDNNPVQKIRQGTFFRVQPREEYSTLTADTDDEVTFINTNDMYIYETNAIPQGSVFFGEIEDVKEPVQGRNGAIKIAIKKVITPDKKTYKLKGHIYSENDNYIGGQATESIYYHKVPHRIEGLRPFLQAVPVNIFEQGKHTVIRPGEEMFIILEEDIIIK